MIAIAVYQIVPMDITINLKSLNVLRTSEREKEEETVNVILIITFHSKHKAESKLISKAIYQNHV